MHAADHRHDGIAPVPGHAAAVHVQGPRVHTGLLVHVQAVARGAQAHMAGQYYRDVVQARERTAGSGVVFLFFFLLPL